MFCLESNLILYFEIYIISNNISHYTLQEKHEIEINF